MMSKNNEAQFIRTNSPEAAQKLRGLDFTEIPSTGEFFFFINNGKQLFDMEANGCVYTNILCF